MVSTQIYGLVCSYSVLDVILGIIYYFNAHPEYALGKLG